VPSYIISHAVGDFTLEIFSSIKIPVVMQVFEDEISIIIMNESFCLQIYKIIRKKVLDAPQTAKVLFVPSKYFRDEDLFQFGQNQNFR